MILGQINAAYGLKGWVKVFSYTDPIEQILNYAPWTLKTNDRSAGREQTTDRVVAVSKGKRHGNGLVALVEGAETRDDAEALIGAEILVDRARLLELDEGEYYWHQLQELLVVNVAGDVLGRVDRLMETGANDVIVVKPSAESIDGVSRLIPYVEDRIVREVDLDNARIIVDWQTDY